MKNNVEELKKLLNAVGVLAETSLVFYRSTLGAGATMEEAKTLTQQFIAIQLFGNRNEGLNQS